MISTIGWFLLIFRDDYLLGWFVLIFKMNSTVGWFQLIFRDDYYSRMVSINL